MLSYAQAIKTVLDTVSPLPPVTRPLDKALGQVLAEPARARWDFPGCDNSAMDGFALRAAAVDTGNPIEVIDFLPAGRQLSGAIPAGKAVRIMTGAPMPNGCDTVVPFEDVTASNQQVILQALPGPGQHVRLRGEEFRQGETLLSAGTLLQSGELGLLAAAGVEQVMVHPTPQVAFLVTGDELVELGEEPVDGKIVNSNLYLIRSRLQECGYPVVDLGTVGDRQEALAAQLERGFDADLVITTGGVSIGDHDYIRTLCDQLGMEVHFWKVAIKPGKPLLFAERNGIPFFGLPGNPAASAATFELFVRPALHRLAGHNAPEPIRISARLDHPVKNRGKREHFLWGEVSSDLSDGTLTFAPSTWQGSGQNRSLQGFNALLPVPAGCEWDVDQTVQPLLLRMPR